MINVIIHGCSGRMGKALDRIIGETDGIQIAAGIDAIACERSYPTYTNIFECDASADAIIDFSSASAVPALLDYALEKKLPLVLCSTGLSAESEEKLIEVSKNIPLLRSANMSLGVNLLSELVKQAAAVLYENGFDIEIIEKHHNQKADAPSGTALMLADSAKSAVPKLNYVYGRSGICGARKHDELGILAVRGGTIPGDHDVLFAGEDEIITLSHSAISREIFAKGAVRAAVWLFDKLPGKYDMSDVIGLKK